MKSRLTILMTCLTVCLLAFLIINMAETSQASSLGLSPAQYANGKLRAKAAENKVRPSLTKELQKKGLKWGSPVFLRAFKEEKRLELWVQESDKKTFKLFRKYPIAAASGTLGPKLAEGDGQVPEGFYRVSSRLMNPQSRYHLAFNIGYPNRYDKKQGRTGSYIMVHGSNVSIGCLAMTDEKIEEIYSLCAAAHRGGQRHFSIHIFPFHMTDKRLDIEKTNRWHPFWKKLKLGYDAFEKNKIPLKKSPL